MLEWPPTSYCAKTVDELDRHFICACGGTAVTGDLKSPAGNGVWVQIPLGVPRLYKLLLDSRIGKNYQEKFLINPLTNPKKFDIIKMLQRTAP